MSDREFWQAVYIACIRAGVHPSMAKRYADLAVKDLEAHTQ